MHSQFVPGGETIDLTNCDREPIHTPGSIQSHGALLLVDAATERILAASTNIAAFAGIAYEDVINARISDVFDEASADRVRAAAAQATGTRAAFNVPLERRRVNLTVQRLGRTVYVEFEPREAAPAVLVAGTRDAVRAFVDLDDIDALCAAGALELRALTGYDRVMIYRFDPDGHGHVIAEARDPKLEAFLGRHYPASDIPRQARALYRTTMLRMIVDVAATPVRLEPAADPRSGELWDLGSAILRSSSPIHIEYLRNMGVTGTLTVSLLRGGELWGLIACHHYTPKFAGADVRYATETVGHALVSRIVQLEDERISAAQLAARDALLSYVTRARPANIDALVGDAIFHAALNVHGVAFVDGTVQTSGSVPVPERLAELVHWLRERSGAERFVTDSLAKLNPAFANIANVASGVYAARQGDAWLVAFRAEDVQTVDWGGDPAKPATAGDGGRLSPRGSFALWREEVHQRAVPWEPWTLDALDRAVAWSGAASAE